MSSKEFLDNLPKAENIDRPFVEQFKDTNQHNSEEVVLPLYVDREKALKSLNEIIANHKENK